MTTNFPILRLPQVAFSEIVNLANPSELVMLALCSKRAFNLVKYYRKKLKKEELHFLFSDCNATIYRIIGRKRHGLIWVSRGFDRFPEWDCNGPPWKESIIKEYSFETGGIMSISCALSCKSLRDGFIWVIHWLTELFRSDVTRLIVDKSTIDWIDDIRNWEKTMISVILDEEESMIPEKDYQKILDCKAPEVILRTRLNTSTFEYPGILPKRDTLILTNAYWFTSSHLMESDYKHLEVEGSNVTNRDLNQFIKQWVMGGKENLKVLAIDTNEEIDWDVVFDGFQEKCHQLPEKQVIRYMSPARVIFRYRNIDIYIKRDDGTIAVVHWKEKKFILFVFPDDFNTTLQL